MSILVREGMNDRGFHEVVSPGSDKGLASLPLHLPRLAGDRNDIGSDYPTSRG